MGLLHITKNHTGKMKGMWSISTSVRQNEYCQQRMENENCVCCRCYAERMMKMYSTMEECFTENGKILSQKVIDPDYLPIINALYFRFESFGDLINETHVINYFNICKKNPGVKFALWTKNPFLIAKAIENGNEKPQNLKIIYSSPMLNAVINLHFDFIDKIFTVYRKDFDVDINCGGKKCIECRLCYEDNNIKFINERIK